MAVPPDDCSGSGVAGGALLQGARILVFYDFTLQPGLEAWSADRCAGAATKPSDRLQRSSACPYGDFAHKPGDAHAVLVGAGPDSAGVISINTW